jgi:hypothetical protein
VHHQPQEGGNLRPLSGVPDLAPYGLLVFVFVIAL